MKFKLTTIIQKSPEGGYVGFIEEIPGVNTQGETLKEVKENLWDAFSMLMDYNRSKAEKKLSRTRKTITKNEFNFVAA